MWEKPQISNKYWTRTPKFETFLKIWGQFIYVIMIGWVMEYTFQIPDDIRDLEVDGEPSKENLFQQTVLLMNGTYIVLPWTYL